MTNLPAQLSTLKQEIGTLTDQLKPASADFLAKCLNRLKASGMAVPTGIAPEDFIREYSFALDGIAEVGLVRAFQKLKRGEYPDVNPDFIPRPAALAVIARNEARTIHQDLARLKEKQASLDLVFNRPAPPSEEAKARVRNLIQQFKAARVIEHHPADQTTGQ